MKLSKLLSSSEIESAVDKIAGSIANLGYPPEDTVVIVLLEGGRWFYNRLCEKLEFNNVIFLKATSYSGDKRGALRFEQFPMDIDSKYVIILDDIIDSGSTLLHLDQTLRSIYPDIEVINSFTLFDKKNHLYIPTMTGISLPYDKFVVGCGLDYNGEYRDLNEIYYIEDIE